MPAPTLFASFVGIDAYPLIPLSGCVKDVLAMDLILRQQMAQQNNMAYKPCYFLAPKPSGEAAIDEYAATLKIEAFKYKSPTFQTVSTEAFAHLKNAQNGDTCIFYYSGHGSQTDAPEVFWHTKPDRQNETIVCVDSRDAGNEISRDIIDKELAFLLWDILNGKNIHCLVIMDCCHSGNNTREFIEVADTDTRYRYCPSAKNNISFEQYLGYDKGFYTVNNGNAGITTARYVHLAAARDSEKAQETSKGGLFTRKLMDVLRAGGTSKSYRELMQAVSITVHNYASQQNPVAFARENNDLDLKFLGRDIKPYQPAFEVRYDFNRNQWLMYGGAMHHITASSGTAKTMVKITGMPVQAAVTEVEAMISVLDDTVMASLNKEEGQYEATISSMANPAITIGLAPALRQQRLVLQSLQQAYQDTKHLYFVIDFNGFATEADFIIQQTADQAFILTKPGSRLPLFKREKDAGNFLTGVAAVSKWVSTLELNNANTAFTKDDFIFRLEKLEGKEITPQNSNVWETFTGQVMEIVPGVEQVFQYREENRPAFRLSITLKNENIQSCYIGALYMNSLFGIGHNLIEQDKGRLLNNSVPLHLVWNFKGNDYKTIPLSVDKVFQENDINEISEFIKLFISTEPANLERYEQPSLKPDVMRSRSAGFGDEAETDNGTVSKPDWAVFTFPFRIVRAAKEKKLEGGRSVDFSSFVMVAPVSFTATVFAATGNDVQQKLNTITRSADDTEGLQLSQMIAPPENIWEDTLTSETLFTEGLSQAIENGIRIVEFFAGNDAAELQLPAGEEIHIRPKAGLRSVDDNGLKETIIPFGYDQNSQNYCRLGFTDESGTIHIQQLPSPTPGIISRPGVFARSNGNSVKLFFKKIYRHQQENQEVLPVPKSKSG